MPNPFYAPGENRAAKVQDLFAAIAPRYDRINDLQSFGLHRHWKRRVVKCSRLKPGETALDLCCGTGDLAFALARAGGKVVGLDFSAPMLEVARERSRRAASPQVPIPVEWVLGDALKTPFADASFDVVTIGYGLRNLASCEAGIREMRRLLRRDGRAIVLDFGKPESPLWRSLYLGYLRLAVPVFGTVFCGNAAAYAYILESLNHYPAQKGVEAFMKAAGFQRTEVIDLLGGAMSINLGEA